jgi:phosphoribosylglycinamide formyltransferase-1
VNAEATTQREFVNLLVELDERFDDATLARAHETIERAGFVLDDVLDERMLSWIDFTFGGTWSSELLDASAIFATRKNDREPVAFAGYGATSSTYYWMRAWKDRDDVGVLGPLGVPQALRGTALARAVVDAALARLKRAGFRHTLIPAVTEAFFDFFSGLPGVREVERFSMNRVAPDLRTVVLASGGGTNFQAVVDELPNGLGLDVRALVVNRPEAFAAERARRANVPVHVHAWDRATAARREYDDALISLVAQSEPDLVLLLGWMHVLPAAFVERFPLTVNIHPAFLPYDGSAETVTMPDGVTIPAFRGAHAIRDAIAASSPWYGATAHRVEVEFDRGTILKRAPLRLTEKEEEKALAALRPTEHAVLIGAVRRILAER